jgi:dihydrofolate synthase/folylpolyglutamate synthase
MADKAIVEMLELMAGTIDHWYTGDLPLPRALKGVELADLLQRHIRASTVFEPTICDAFRRALDEAGADDRIVVIGSFVTVAQILSVHL